MISKYFCLLFSEEVYENIENYREIGLDSENYGAIFEEIYLDIEHNRTIKLDARNYEEKYLDIKNYREIYLDTEKYAAINLDTRNYGEKLDVENYGSRDRPERQKLWRDRPGFRKYGVVDIDIEKYVGIDLDTGNYAHRLLGDRYRETSPKASRYVIWEEMKIWWKSVLSMILSSILWLLIRPLHLYLFQ